MTLRSAALGALLAASLTACTEPDVASDVEPADIQSALNACIQGDLTGDMPVDSVRALTAERRASLDGLTTGIARLDSLNGLHPGNADVLATRGLCRAVRFAADSVQADARAAYNDLSNAAVLIEAAPDAFQTPLDQLYSQRAFVVQALRPDDWPAALADFDRAVALAPSNPVHVLDRGVARALSGDTAAARTDLNQFMAIAPEQAAQADALRGLLGDSLVGSDIVTLPLAP